MKHAMGLCLLSVGLAATPASSAPQLAAVPAPAPVEDGGPSAAPVEVPPPVAAEVPAAPAQPATTLGSEFPADDEKAAIAWMDEHVRERKTSVVLKVSRFWLEKEKRPELMWRFVQVVVSHYEVHNDLPDAERLKAYETAERVTRACIAAKGPPHCEFFLGSSLGRQATVKGLLGSLRLLRGLEATWTSGLERSKGRPEYVMDGHPLEAYFYYALGVMYRVLPDMWLVKLITGVRGDLDKAIAFHRKSAALRPDLSTSLELGVALMCSGHKRDNAAHMKEGRTLVEGVITRPAKTALDGVDQRNAKFLLENPKKACGYSRDKMQDVEDASKAK